MKEVDRSFRQATWISVAAVARRFIFGTVYCVEYISPVGEFVFQLLIASREAEHCSVDLRLVPTFRREGMSSSHNGRPQSEPDSLPAGISLSDRSLEQYTLVFTSEPFLLPRVRYGFSAGT